MRLDFDPQEFDKIADSLAQRVAEKLRPLLKPQGQYEDTIFTIETLSEYLRVKKEWVYANIKYIPHYKIGRFPRFRKKEIDMWLECNKSPSFEHLRQRPSSIKSASTT